MTETEYNHYWNKGFEAWYVEGDTAKNPYPKYCPMWFAWRDGWNNGEEEN